MHLAGWGCMPSLCVYYDLYEIKRPRLKNSKSKNFSGMNIFRKNRPPKKIANSISVDLPSLSRKNFISTIFFASLKNGTKIYLASILRNLVTFLSAAAAAAAAIRMFNLFKYL